MLPACCLLPEPFLTAPVFFFLVLQVIGCSIFMLYDDREVGAWLIDFAKTVPVPDGRTLDHRSPWRPGNREEGFLFGLDNLIQVLNDA